MEHCALHICDIHANTLQKSVPSAAILGVIVVYWTGMTTVNDLFCCAVKAPREIKTCLVCQVLF